METTAATKGTKGHYFARRVGWWEGATRNDIIEANGGLVYVVAGQFRKRMGSLTIEDLQQEGFIGIGEAFDRYDKSRGQFSTYATYWIRQRILAVIEAQSMTIRTPTYVQSLIRKQRRGAEITDRQAALIHRSGVASKVERIGLSVIDSENFSRPMEPFAREDESIDSEAIDAIMIAVDKLGTLQKEIILARFGIGCEPQTLNQLAERFGYTKEWIRQMESKAIKRLRILCGLKGEDAA